MIFGGKVFWRIAGRFYHKRSQRSLRLHRVFKEKSEKFFQRVKGQG